MLTLRAPGPGDEDVAPAARAAGVGRVLVTCDDDNLGSIAVIERCGGRRDPGWPGDDGTRRYWIA